MNIEINTYTDEDWYTKQQMLINGISALRVTDLNECPEDAIIGRDLVDCNDVVKLMQLAWEAGVRGEEFVVTNEDKAFD